jgi:hypothetical protein
MEQRAEYIAYVEKIREDFIRGVELMDDNDKLYILDKIEESRWQTGASYNRGVHILMDMIQYAVEASYASPNMRAVK